MPTLIKRLQELEQITPSNPDADWYHIAVPTDGGYLMRRMSDGTSHLVTLDDIQRIAIAGSAPVIILDK